MSILKQREFLIYWLGQTMSIFGTYMTSFALSVWVYQKTGSVTQLATVLVVSSIPSIIIPFAAGTLVDRWNKKHILIISDSIAAVLTLIMVFFIQIDSLTMWIIYTVTLLQTVGGMFQHPASSAVVQTIVPKEQMGRATALSTVGYALATIAAPLVAGAFYGMIGLAGIMLIDLLTFAFAMLTLWVIHIPDMREKPLKPLSTLSLYQEFVSGLDFFRKTRGMLTLLFFTVVAINIFGLAKTLLTPLVLSFGNADDLGFIYMVAGIGGLIGSVFITVLGPPKRRIYGVLGYGIFSGLSFIFGGLQQSVTLIAVASFFVMAGLPIMVSCINTITLSHVPPKFIGRITSIQSACGAMVSTLILVTLGPVADYIFKPILLPDGLLAPTVGRIIGVGEGRGFALMFMSVGVVTISIMVIGLLSPKVRHLESYLPEPFAWKESETEVNIEMP